MLWLFINFEIMRPYLTPLIIFITTAIVLILAFIFQVIYFLAKS